MGSKKTYHLTPLSSILRTKTLWHLKKISYRLGGKYIMTKFSFLMNYFFKTLPFLSLFLCYNIKLNLLNQNVSSYVF